MLIKVYKTMELRQALRHSAEGGIAVHLHSILTPTAPSCFVRDVNSGLPIAHVFGRDVEKLSGLAKRLGVRVIYIDKRGTDSQHIDFCGTPLAKLLTMAGDDIENYRIAGDDYPF